MEPLLNLYCLVCLSTTLDLFILMMLILSSFYLLLFPFLSPGGATLICYGLKILFSDYYISQNKLFLNVDLSRID